MTTEPWIVKQKISIPFNYTTGPALDHFFRSLQKGKLIASVCSSCGRRFCPPLSFCGRCWKPITEFVDLSGRGTLASYAILSSPVAELPDVSPPVVYGLIALEGADTHLAHLVQSANAESLRVGAAVEAVWRENRTASILDIACFRAI